MAHPPARRSSRATEPADAIGVIGHCRRADLSLTTGIRTDLVCDAAEVRVVDLGTLDALARLGLAARRHGLGLIIECPPRGLLDLLDLCGLGGLLARLQSPPTGQSRRAGRPKSGK